MSKMTKNEARKLFIQIVGEVAPGFEQAFDKYYKLYSKRSSNGKYTIWVFEAKDKNDPNIKEYFPISGSAQETANKVALVFRDSAEEVTYKKDDNGNVTDVRQIFFMPIKENAEERFVSVPKQYAEKIIKQIIDKDVPGFAKQFDRLYKMYESRSQMDKNVKEWNFKLKDPLSPDVPENFPRYGTFWTGRNSVSAIYSKVGKEWKYEADKNGNVIKQRLNFYIPLAD